MITASQLHGGHGSPLPAYQIWPGSLINLLGGTVYVLEVEKADDFEGEPQVSIKYRVDYDNGSFLIGVCEVNALRSFDIIPNPEPF